MVPNCSVTQALKWASQQLAAAGIQTPRLDAEVLLAHTLNREKSWLYIHPQFQLAPRQSAAFSELVSRRQAREPVAYIIGHKEFYGLDFWVNRHALIPRPETELLVETALAQASDINKTLSISGNSSKRLLIADVGAGSGCIAITLARHLTTARVLAGDISAQALQLARQNAVRHQVAAQITFLQGDMLTPLAASIDMIVSNPPYVSRPELKDVMPEVNRYEPQQALDGGPDGLDIIRRLVGQAAQKLGCPGSLLVEIGYRQGQQAKILAKDFFPDATIEIKKDLAGLDRLLVVQNIQAG